MASLCGADLAVSAISGDAPLRSLCATAGQLVVTTPAKLAQVVSWVVGAGRGSGWDGWLAGCAACFTCPQAELMSCHLLCPQVLREGLLTPRMLEERLQVGWVGAAGAGIRAVSWARRAALLVAAPPHTCPCTTLRLPPAAHSAILSCPPLSPSLPSQVLILDEADLLLSYGYEADVAALAPQIPRACQCLLMSATGSADVDRLTQVGPVGPVD